MAGDRRTIGWLLDERDRELLLKLVPPAYPRTIAHHLTLKSGAEPGEEAPPARQAAVVGIAGDGAGVQTLVAQVNGTTERPDGGTYHITWSLAPGREAIESNDVIAGHDWTPFGPVPIRLRPASF